jgi:hypothetical protein
MYLIAIAVFWVVLPCNAERARRFKEHRPSSGPKSGPRKKPAEAAQLNFPPASPDFLLDLLFNPVDGDDMLFRNIGPCLTSWPYSSGDPYSHRSESLKSSIFGGDRYLYHDRCEQLDYVLAMCSFCSCLYDDLRKHRTMEKSHPRPTEFPIPTAFLSLSLPFPPSHPLGARSNIVGWGTMLQAGRSLVRFPMRELDFFNLPNPSNRAMALGSSQPLTKMNTRNIPGG